MKNFTIDFNSLHQVMDLETTKKTLHYIGDILPHGLGFDNDWNIKMTSQTKIRASSSFHCMDENGMYDGWADFSILFDLFDQSVWRVMFHGKDSQKFARRYALRDYISDTVAEIFYDNFGEGPMYPPEDYAYED